MFKHAPAALLSGAAGVILKHLRLAARTLRPRFLANDHRPGRFSNMTSLLAHVRFQGRAHRSASRPGRKPLAAETPGAARRATHIELAGDETRLLDAILTQGGLELHDLRPAPLARRLHAVLRALRVRDARQALALVERSAESHRRALSALLIGHTLPFRDESVFQSLRRFVVPRLEARPRVWSIGCSRGLELLSVSLLLEERSISPSAMRGSDVREIDMLHDASLVRDFAADVPAEFAELAARVTPAWVRSQVRAIDWRCENALTAEPEGSWDLILCRNLAIYLEADAAARLWQRIADALKPGGFLVVGKAERPLVSGLHRSGPCIYKRPRQLSSGGPHGN